jgi:hypothetical protein
MLPRLLAPLAACCHQWHTAMWEWPWKCVNVERGGGISEVCISS